MDAKFLEIQLKFLLEAAYKAYPTADFKYTVRNIKKDDSWFIAMTNENSLNSFFFAQGTGKMLDEAVDNIKVSLLAQINKAKEDLSYRMAKQNNVHLDQILAFKDAIETLTKVE